MIERVLITIGLVMVGFALYKIFIALQLRQAQAALPGLEGKEVGKYLILYFTSPTCAPCRTTQQPALKKVQDVFGDQLQIITVDVTEQPAVAEQWRVMTLPTTYLFDASGTPNECNLGVTYADRLIQQIKAMGAQSRTLQQQTSA
jgi:thioredoxin 1